MKILKITVQENHRLFVQGDQGEIGIFDVAPYLDSEAFSPLKDPSEFERVITHGRFIEWACGADLSADTLEVRMKKVDNSPG